MVKKGSLIPENDTMVSVLSACSKLDMSNIEKWIGSFRYDLGCSGCDSVSTVLVYLYGKLGMVDKSREIFEQISSDGKRSVLSWNAMIGVYVQNGCALDGLCLFRLMMELNCCCPNHVTMVNVLSACTQVGDLDLGLWVHEYMKGSRQRSFLLSNANLATALIDILELAQIISSILVEVDPNNSAGYVMLSNTYAIDHHWSAISRLSNNVLGHSFLFLKASFLSLDLHALSEQLEEQVYQRDFPLNQI
ncbi:hypothetical protein K7X08_012060 [Anisodus acutangulus]|uniref:Pentatricopeptide repeat-containing protein n=1 Tax=Anisodus acutangulus TaxID=402998 RepID=A0A9Q1LAM1_9SOLA|nr:hypothetical protein K7X08_012060 [Anisodus acutangulus]